MKAIVVRQPGASLIALGVKTIETRPSPPNGPMRPEGVRGLPGCTLERGERIAIVAAADRSVLSIRYGDPIEHMLSAAWLALKRATSDHLDYCIEPPFGAVVCTATVTDAFRSDVITFDRTATGRVHLGPRRGDGQPDYATVPPDQLPLGEYDPGCWGWLLADPTPCHPVPVKGRQGVFVLPDSVEAAVRAQIPPASTPLEGTQA